MIIIYYTSYSVCDSNVRLNEIELDKGEFLGL